MPGAGRVADCRAMRTDEYWALIDQARSAAGGVAESVPAHVSAVLARRAADDIVGFDRHQQRVLTASYRVDLWGAAYLINGGCSDDGFENFRGWLITQGRAVFARAVAEPDSLADLPAVRRAATTGVELELAEMLDAARRAYRQVTGDDLPTPTDPVRRPELGAFWDFDDEDEVRRRMPRLAALFAEPPEE